MTDEEMPVSDKYLHYLALSITQDRNIVDDLIQEGRIEAWKLAEKKPGLPSSYYVKAVKGRMKNLAYYKYRPTGALPRAGIDVSDMRLASLDEPVDEYGTTIGDLVAEQPDKPLSPEDGYRQREVRTAIEKLPEDQRRYVYARFWDGLSWSDLKAKGLIPHEGLPKKRLQEALSHLI